MQKVRRLQVYTGRMVDDLFAGEYSSAFKGRGMEFDEVRQYLPGDDVRDIDWNVTARTGHPHIKRFVEERELTVMLAVDLSASGAFGSIDRVKNETAAEICAVLAMAAVKNNDKVGLMVFTDEVEHYLPPAKGSRHSWRVVRDVLDFDPRGHSTDVPAALEHLGRMLRKRAVIFLVSDFLFEGAGGVAAGDGEKSRADVIPAHAGTQRRREDLVAGNDAAERLLESRLRMLMRRHDLIALSISDPREHELVGAGLIEVQDAETGQRRLIDTGGRLRRRFAKQAAEREAALERQLRRLGIDLVRIRTHQPYVHSLIELFRKRERRR